MHISEIEVENYKSFNNSGSIRLSCGFNVITAQNNAGKTALLELIGSNFTSRAHRSLKSMPRADSILNDRSAIRIVFALSRDELLRVLAKIGNDLRIPYPNIPEGQTLGVDFRASGSAALQEFLNAVFRRDSFNFNLRYYAESGRSAWTCAEFPSFGVYRPAPADGNGGRSFIQFLVAREGELRATGGTTSSESTELGVVLANLLQGQIYRFSAERFNIGSCAVGSNPNLAQNASNLPEVLSVLQPDPSRFRDFNEAVSSILPGVMHVSVRPSGNQVEILVWSINPDERRIDLAIPLNQCGTGIGQVLAILYVVLYSDQPKIILIDEPQSFLHPGAARKLIEVLRQHHQHQYIVATHSPVIISASNAETLSILRLVDGESVVEQIDSNSERRLEGLLAEVGARLSDVFGADRVLWVEGSTEERCFPVIIEKIAKRPLMGTNIVGVIHTGDLAGRDANKILDIYGRLCKGGGLLPPAVGFIFDLECRTQKQQDDLRRRTGGRLRFLPQRMYENYLLSPEAIAAVVNSIQGFRDTLVTPEEIVREFDSKRVVPEYFCSPDRGFGPDFTNWQRSIDGARVLSEIFSNLSQNRVSFDKTRHCPAITEWIVQNQPDRLIELSDFLVRVLEERDGVGAAKPAFATAQEAAESA